MLRLLTDEHISPAVADAAQRYCGADVTPMRDWEHGQMLSAPDDILLGEARRQGLTLVSYDLRTLPPLLRSWAEEAMEHGGVVLVDQKTIDQTDIGGLAHALCELWRTEHRRDWKNRVVYLRAE